MIWPDGSTELDINITKHCLASRLWIPAEQYGRYYLPRSPDLMRQSCSLSFYQFCYKFFNILHSLIFSCLGLNLKNLSDLRFFSHVCIIIVLLYEVRIPNSYSKQFIQLNWANSICMNSIWRKRFVVLDGLLYCASRYCMRFSSYSEFAHLVTNCHSPLEKLAYWIRKG